MTAKSWCWTTIFSTMSLQLLLGELVLFDVPASTRVTTFKFNFFGFWILFPSTIGVIGCLLKFSNFFLTQELQSCLTSFCTLHFYFFPSATAWQFFELTDPCLHFFFLCLGNERYNLSSVQVETNSNWLQVFVKKLYNDLLHILLLSAHSSHCNVIPGDHPQACIWGLASASCFPWPIFRDWLTGLPHLAFHFHQKPSWSSSSEPPSTWGCRSRGFLRTSSFWTCRDFH